VLANLIAIPPRSGERSYVTSLGPQMERIGMASYNLSVEQLDDGALGNQKSGSHWRLRATLVCARSEEGTPMLGMTVGHYQITAKLGAGGVGEVFLAEDTRLDRKAAIKISAPRKSSEAAAAGSRGRQPMEGMEPPNQQPRSGDSIGTPRAPIPNSCGGEALANDLS